jgi:hypothetical protein
MACSTRGLGGILVARPSGSIGLIWGFASVLDRAKANSAISRCRMRVVPLRTVNGRLRGWLGPAVLDGLLLEDKRTEARNGAGPFIVA